MPTSTPWGLADHVKPMQNGVFWVDTPRHGGLFVPDELLKKMPASCRKTPYSSGGWFEEDADCALPIAILGAEAGFNDGQVKAARDMILKDRKREEPYLSKLVPADMLKSWEG